MLLLLPHHRKAAATSYPQACLGLLQFSENKMLGHITSCTEIEQRPWKRQNADSHAAQNSDLMRSPKINTVDPQLGVKWENCQETRCCRKWSWGLLRCNPSFCVMERLHHAIETKVSLQAMVFQKTDTFKALPICSHWNMLHYLQDMMGRKELGFPDEAEATWLLHSQQV